jgi:hypothetical protein|tara:strand:- start:230 stop:490 length:261 start_codon:yes stop_codon:yes gene_type:complete
MLYNQRNGENMLKIIKSSSGTLADPKRIARGSASNVIKKGAFYTFSLTIDNEDIREYSFTDRTRADTMREILISHLENKIINDLNK